MHLKDMKKIQNKGINRLAIEFLNHQAANDFVNNERLKNKGYNIFIPYNFISCKGLVRYIDLDIDISKFSEICRSNVEIISAKKLNRKVLTNNKPEYIATGSVLFTFKGTCLPKFIEFYGLALPVTIYIPPVTQCFSCLLYGHTKHNCKGKLKCFNCGEKNTIIMTRIRIHSLA